MDAALSGPTGRIELGTTPLKIGRLSENQLIINDAQASSLHAEICPIADGYAVVDLGTTNGTFVNEQRLASHTPQHLQAGDSIRIGDTRYVYETDDQVAPTASASSLPPADPAALPAALPPEQQKSSEYQGFSPVYSPPAQSGRSFSSLGYSARPDPALPDRQSSPAENQGSQSLMPLSAQKNDRKSLSIIWGTLALVLVLTGGVTGVFFFRNLSTPTKTLDAFCSSIQNKKGRDAFDLLSDSLRRQSLSSKEVFISIVDSGQIVDCSHSSPIALDNNANAQLTLKDVNGRSQTDTVLLIMDHEGAWKINRLQIIQA